MTLPQVGVRSDSDVPAKSYRYLRIAMVGLLVCLAAAVVYQSVDQDSLLGSVSAYYYTPAQGIFVGALIGLGACMIALKGTTPVEDVLRNLGGVFAAVVAIVPTARDADHQAAVRACRESSTPLLTERASTGPDCPTVRALAEATRANVENNLSALLFVGALALGAALFFAHRDGTLGARTFWLGFAAAVALWVAGLGARRKFLTWSVDHAHFRAAGGLFACVLVVAVVNARRVRAGGPDDTATRLEQSVTSVRDVLSRRKQDEASDASR